MRKDLIHNKINPEWKEYFHSCKRIFIYGAGNLGLRLLKILKRLNIEIIFIDADSNKQNNEYFGCKVISPIMFYKLTCEKECIVIVALSKENEVIVLKKLAIFGFRPGINAFCFDEIFQDYYLPQLFYYHTGVLYVKNVDLPLTQFCNLKCKACSIRTPYVVNPMHEELNELEKTCDAFFDWIDYVENFYLIGGEPLLYPHLFEIIQYVSDRYSERIGHIVVATNGLMPLKDDFLLNLHKAVEFQISDYSIVHFQYKQNVDRFCEKLKRYKIKFNRMTDFEWTDYGFGYHITRDACFNAIQFFDDCGIDCRGLYKSKLYYCFPAMMVDRVENVESDIDSYFDLQHFNEFKKKELLSFLLGINKKGYINRCLNCNGCYRTNKNIIAVAEQL